MSFKLGKKAALCCALALGFYVLGETLSGARGVPASEGIVNFGKVNDVLYRGAQPDEVGLSNLKRLGVKTIINLRMADDAWREEATKAAAHGIVYTNVPFRALSRPTDEQVKIVLELINSMPGPVFVHCQHGCDRTGTIVACYRMKQEEWTFEKAMAEANRYGISVFERGMKRFVADFSKVVAKMKKATSSPGTVASNQ